MTMSSFDRSLNQTIDYLQKQKKLGTISHWELEMSDASKRMFSVRVSKTPPWSGASVFDARVSMSYRGRDLLSAARRAVAEVSHDL